MERANQFVGQSLAFLDAVERASRAAPLNRPVLVIGERGTGKELIAERLHHLSSRWAGPLVTMNCAALPENLIEAELFGHEAGSFTGAAKTRHGRFEEADGGTLFLDELATLSSPAQDRLLRAVEYGEVTRIGASKPIQVDVRIVAATNEHLPRLVEEGRFRADLLDRLSFEVVTLPPLRARKGDIRCSPSISAGAWRSSSTGPTGRAFRDGRWPSWKSIPGPAMSASCAMSSSARSIVPRIRSGRSTPSSSIRSPRPGCSAPIRPAPSKWRPMPRIRSRLAAEARRRRRRRRPPTICAGRSTPMKKALLEDALARHRFNQRLIANQAVYTRLPPPCAAFDHLNE